MQNSVSYLPLASVQKAVPQIRCVASDVDGTLTDPRAGAPSGALHPAVAGAITELRAQNLRFVIVTGRPAGFAWTLMQSLGADAAIAENGGVIYFASAPEVAWHICAGKNDWFPFLHQTDQQCTGSEPQSSAPESTLEAAEQRCPRRKAAEAIFHSLQEAGLIATSCIPTHDNLFRLCDFTFPIGGIGAQTLYEIQKAVAAQGAAFVHSSIHGHIMPCGQTKGDALRWALARWDLKPEACLTIGDSPNDESLFNRAVFSHSVGVQNITEHAGAMTERPRYLATGSEGEGFLELLPVFRSTAAPAPEEEGAVTERAGGALEGPKLSSTTDQIALVVFFDGVCVLCNAFADLLIGQLTRRSTSSHNPPRVALAPLQGKTARRLLPPHLQSPPYPSVLSCRVPAEALSPQSASTNQPHRQADGLENRWPVHTLAVRSEAVLHILGELGPGWARFACIMRFVPQRLRDTLYDLVARNRYLLFGKRETCRLPAANDRRWILD